MLIWDIYSSNNWFRSTFGISLGTAKACDVKVSSGTVLETAAGAYNYDPSMTPSMTGLNPTRGGTGGGSSLTISGTGFGT